MVAFSTRLIMKWCAIFLATLAGLTTVWAATYSLAPAADARVIAYPGYLNLNFGSDILSCYTDSSGLNTQRTFIQFDLSSITLAPTQIVQSATLTLTAGTSFGTNTGFQPMQIYRVSSPWSEASLTWSNRDSAHTWTTPGGDFVGPGNQPYAVSTASPTNGQAVTWDITALVQEWVSHVTTNCGLILTSESGNHLTFGQRESTTPPNLTVIVGPGLAPFHAYSSGAQVVLWWTSTNSVLQEKTSLDPAVTWLDSGRSVAQSNGSNSVTISAPKGNNFFRLRGGP
jgi:disaggregatase-related protein